MSTQSLNNKVPGLAQILDGVTAIAEAAAVEAALALTSAGPATITEVDFGSTPVDSAVFTITDAASLTTSAIQVFPDGNTATGRVGNDYSWDAIQYSAVPKNGAFDVHALVINGSVVGKRSISYKVG